MTLPGPAEPIRGRVAVQVAAAVGAVVVAAALFTRFGINGRLSRDQAIYTYGGQQLAHGVPPYASIFDPKTPLATMLAGVGATVGRIVGSHDNVYWIRAVFFGCALLIVLAVYLLAAKLWHSVLAGLVAAVVFASFNGFAMESLSGPDAKMPGILAAILSMWLLIRRQWFWAAFAGALAFLGWQPLVIYPVIAATVAVLCSVRTQRRKAFGIAVAGAAIPLIVVTVYFALAGALGKFFESAFEFPATGVQRGNETLSQHFTRIADVVHQYYQFSGVLFWIGLVMLVVLAGVHLVGNRGALRQAVQDPLICIVLVTGLAEVAYAVFDFQGFPDVFPLLIYPALGLAGAAAVLVKQLSAPSTRRVATAGALVAVTALAAFSWSWFTNAQGIGDFRAQRADGCAVERMLGPAGRLYAIGDPTPLVVLHRRNPDRFIYLGSGVDEWKIKHTPGGFNGWVSQIQAADPSVITLNGWRTRLTPVMRSHLLDLGYFQRFVGKWRVFLSPAARGLAKRDHVRLTGLPTDYAMGTAGHELPPASRCG